MRTTLTLDDDIAGLLQKKSSELGLSFKETVNRTLRQGLTEISPKGLTHRVKTRPHAFGFKAGVDLDRLNQVSDELEALAFRKKMIPGKA
jgi:hypothetical protein